MSLFDSFPTTPPVLAASEPVLDEAQLAAVAFLARYRGRTLTRTAPICVNSSSEPPPSACRRYRRRGLTSSGTGRGWTIAVLARRRLIGAYRRCAATTASPTSTAGSAPTRPSTSGGHESIPPSSGGWTAANSPLSCTPPNAPHRPTPPWPCCWG